MSAGECCLFLVNIYSTWSLSSCGRLSPLLLPACVDKRVYLPFDSFCFSPLAVVVVVTVWRPRGPKIAYFGSMPTKNGTRLAVHWGYRFRCTSKMTKQLRLVQQASKMNNNKNTHTQTNTKSIRKRKTKKKSCMKISIHPQCDPYV